MKIKSERYDDLMASYWLLHAKHKFEWNWPNEGEENYITLPTKENFILTFNLVNMFDDKLEYLLSSKLTELKKFLQ